jgi:broad specificity phosphatase PhoE
LNQLDNLDQLGNRYFVLRHGHSLANQQGLIVSDPANGCHGYGLSEQGRFQLESRFRQIDGLNANSKIISSDFRRAIESAQMAAEALGLAPSIETDARLRERYFGKLELGSDNAYAEIWRRDAEDADHQHRAVESANQVMTRVTELIIDLEGRYVDETILLVSHGDALQILQAAFERFDAASHRQLQHLQTGEIRPLRLALPVSD